MKIPSQKKLFLGISFLLPLILVIVVVGVVYFPWSSVKTDYNFIYALCDSPNSYVAYEARQFCLHNLQGYKVEDGKLSVAVVNKSNPNFKIRLFLHDASKNQTREITLAEAENLRLSGLLTSPDGASVSGDWQYNGGFFIFDSGRSSYNYYLVKGNKRRQLNLINNGRYFDKSNFKFIGWALPAKN